MPENLQPSRTDPEKAPRKIKRPKHERVPIGFADEQLIREVYALVNAVVPDCPIQIRGQLEYPDLESLLRLEGREFEDLQMIGTSGHDGFLSVVLKTDFADLYTDDDENLAIKGALGGIKEAIQTASRRTPDEPETAGRVLAPRKQRLAVHVRGGRFRREDLRALFGIVRTIAPGAANSSHVFNCFSRS